MGRQYLSTVAFVVVFLFIEIVQICMCLRNSSYLLISCVERERQTLLKFKESLQDPSNRLFSWKAGTDCCKWEGVGCDAITGHVINLNLSSCPNWYEKMDSMCNTRRPFKARHVDPSLLELEYLNHLDLSGFNFDGSQIPGLFGSFRKLRYLNLSSSGFSGRIPNTLGNLTDLRVLDLNMLYDYVYPPRFYTCDVDWVSQLSSLQHLDMSGVYLGKVLNLMGVLNSLHSLVHVELVLCGLNNLHIPLGTSINATFLPSVQVLDISYNRFSGPIPDIFQNMTFITHLDLSVNVLKYSVPLWLTKFKYLVYLSLEGNFFTTIQGSLFSFLRKMCQLKLLNLRSNMLQGEIFGVCEQNSSGCARYDLIELDLRSNQIHDHLPSWLEQFKNLMYLRLQSNLLYGFIPPSLGNLSNLRELDLSDFQLNGTIPSNLGQLVNLVFLNLSRNNLIGLIPHSLGQLVNLLVLDLAFNHLYGVIPHNLGQLVSLQYVNLASNHLDGVMPNTLVKNVRHLDVSSNSLEGEFYKILGYNKNINYLDISYNKIKGLLPENVADMMPALSDLLIGNNLIMGSIPNSLCKLKLTTLDLSRNKLSGKIPKCWDGRTLLELINLSSNELSGSIPSSIGNISSLQWLNLSNNSLKGELPLALKNCTNLEILDLGENQFSGHLPSWIGENFSSLQNLRIPKNMFTGSIPRQVCQLYMLKILDFADNCLTGSIPRCLGDLRGMILKKEEEGNQTASAPAPAPYTHDNSWQWPEEGTKQVLKGIERDYTTNRKNLVNMDLSSNSLAGFIPEELTSLSGLIGLNLSHNFLSGVIPNSIGKMKSLESIDFSDNQLVGEIPKTISNLSSLGYLNLSYNNFSGPIPRDRQLTTLGDPSNYAGNPFLCGDSLPKRCPGDYTPQAPARAGHHEDEEDKKEKVWFYFVIALGFVTGFWTVIGVLFFKKNWRHAFFRCIEEAADNVYVTIAIKVARLKKRMANNQAE
ncbi:Leucine-rich repeat receptor protein kinase [Quillaja saponaria]|uniref:Leucine-rich repeat receptor protein kinase n=1 Tax=Quillaja saponaria TaxID=32244 RepID=A0AAD7Q4M6_QUISA|nr:Leucine-rich repeat receptor protein kinase [Quillaja saponaria]